MSASELNTQRSVLIVEDDDAVREHFARSIVQHPGLTLHGAAATFAEAERLMQKCPDVLLVDLGLPDGNGAELIRLLKAREPGSEAIVITVFSDEFRVVEAIRAGAVGYLLKDSMPDDIGVMTMEMLGGISPISPAVARFIINALRPAASPAQPLRVPLSPKELDVLQLVARGYSRDEIAGMMGNSVHTVVSHIRNIYKKLEVNSRNEAVFEACQLGLINLNGQ
ncbi:MAG: response regulator transcription factor [Nitrosomonadales bacterium]|nr:response regulator transcription factor [Nitrosomonadales bacterium]